MKRLKAHNEEETKAVAAELAKFLEPGDVILWLINC